MPLYWATSYFLKPGKAFEYRKWLNSKEARDLFHLTEKETGFKYLGTYFPVLGIGDYDADDWMLAPDWASTDKLRESKAFDTWMGKASEFVDESRRSSTRIMRNARDIQFPRPRK